MYIQISEIEKDLLKEIINIGITKAADAFAVLSKSKQGVILSVPEVNIVEPSQFPDEVSMFDKTVLAIKSDLKGEINGMTLLLFYQEQIQKIVESCLTEEDQKRDDFPQLRLSLLKEIGNILTGAIVTQLSNILGLKIHGTPPVEIIGTKGKSIQSLLCELPPCNPLIVTVRTQFMDFVRVIELPLLIVLDIEALFNIINTIRRKDIYSFNLLKKAGK